MSPGNGGTYAAGWNARCDGQPSDARSSRDFLLGWRDCERLGGQRYPFNRNSAFPALPVGGLARKGVR